MSGSKGTNRKARKPAEETFRDATAAPGKRLPSKDQRLGKLKPGKLVCRYCGSDDLSPSFIKRRDRRCRTCFSQRYGSAARARKRGKRK
jgi:hypothetical protein